MNHSFFPVRRLDSMVGSILTSVLILLATTSVVTAQDEKLPKAEDILKKHIDALGGKSALNKLHNRVAQGTFQVPAQGIKGAFTTYEAARNKNYTTIDLGGIGQIESGSDGQVHWERTAMTGVRILEGTEKDFALRQSTFNGMLYWTKLYKQAATIGEAKVGEQSCYKLEMTPNEGNPEIWYINKESYLHVRTDLVYQGPMGEIPLQIMFEDNKKVDGLVLPHTVRQSMMGMEQVMTIESVKHNVDMPKERFDLPEDVKALLVKKNAEP